MLLEKKNFKKKKFKNTPFHASLFGNGLMEPKVALPKPILMNHLDYKFLFFFFFFHREKKHKFLQKFHLMMQHLIFKNILQKLGLGNWHTYFKNRKKYP
jgi:hypothetical protein